MKGLKVAGLFLLLSLPIWAQSLKEGKNSVTIRGQSQDVYFYPATTSGTHRKVVFIPGDGGFHGFAVTIAEKLAAGGYDVYGIGTRRYLQSFTGSTVLKISEIASDYRQLAQAIRQRPDERVLLVGWSEGAGLGLATMAEAASRDYYDGLVAVGMTEFNILAWRWKDLGAEMTKSLPDEPTFKSADVIGKVSPSPLFVVASSGDEYVTQDATRELFAAAKDPKRLVMITASDHKYSRNTDQFFRVLQEGLGWIQQQRR